MVLVKNHDLWYCIPEEGYKTGDPVLANRVQYFKQDAKGVATMCRAMEEMRNETVRERNIEIAKTMLASKKLSYEDIALFSGLTVDEVKSLDAKKPA